MSTCTVNVIGAGLAGVEAAWQIARQGVHVRLYEMKPSRYSPAHTSPYMAELVCSNSLRSDSLENAVNKAYENVKYVSFENAFYRQDIGQRALNIAREK